MLLQFNFNRPQCDVITYCWYRSLILMIKSSIFFSYFLLAGGRSISLCTFFLWIFFLFCFHLLTHRCSVTHIQDEKWFYHLLRSTYSSYVRWVIIIIANILWLPKPIYQLLARKVRFLIVTSFFSLLFLSMIQMFLSKFNNIFFVGMLPHEK